MAMHPGGDWLYVSHRGDPTNRGTLFVPLFVIWKKWYPFWGSKMVIEAKKFSPCFFAFFEGPHLATLTVTRSHWNWSWIWCFLCFSPMAEYSSGLQKLCLITPFSSSNWTVIWSFFLYSSTRLRLDRRLWHLRLSPLPGAEAGGHHVGVHPEALPGHAGRKVSDWQHLMASVTRYGHFPKKCVFKRQVGIYMLKIIKPHGYHAVKCVCFKNPCRSWGNMKF